jgi:dCTP deaminase
LIFSRDGEMLKFDDLKYSDHDGSVLLTLGLNFEISGFEAIETGEPIDLSLKNYYDPRYFFRPVFFPGDKDQVVLRANSFYILSTEEYVRVPENLACEMVPMDERSGDLRSHYAGYIDPGWGCGKDNDAKGRPLTLEVRLFEDIVFIHDKHPIAKIRFERMIEPPDAHYDQMNPTYGIQSGPKLGKYFKEWK